MSRSRLKFGVFVWIASALVITATHWVSANGQFYFAGGNESDYVEVKRLADGRFSFSRCRGASDCVVIGKKQGFAHGDVTQAILDLNEKRERGHLSTVETHDLETLETILRGLDRPYPKPNGEYRFSFKITAEQFERVVNERLKALPEDKQI